jgi:stearoyl-CoA desaturase (delta-9 desaturase)
VTAGVLGHWLIGYFAHNKGARHYDVGNAAVQGHNIPLTSILTMGECWHNNHHAFPGSARLGLFPGEWDPGWWTLLLLRRLGLAWDFRLPEHLPARAELQCLDEAAAARLQASRFSRKDPGLAALGLPALRRLLRDPVDATRPPRLEWPAALLSLKNMRRLMGNGVELRVDPALDRLVLHQGLQQILGLPAFCAAMARRGGAGRAIATCLLPLAVGLEAARSSLAVR